MATTDVTNTLVANVSSTEQSTSNVPINRGTGNPAYACNVGVFATYVQLGGSTNIVLPITTVTQLYIKNIDPTLSCIVNWTPKNASNATILELNPGDQIIFWSNPGGATSPGITSLTLTGTGLVEYFLGG